MKREENVNENVKQHKKTRMPQIHTISLGSNEIFFTSTLLSDPSYTISDKLLPNFSKTVFLWIIKMGDEPRGKKHWLEIE